MIYDLDVLSNIIALIFEFCYTVGKNEMETNWNLFFYRHFGDVDSEVGCFALAHSNAR